MLSAQQSPSAHRSRPSWTGWLFPNAPALAPADDASAACHDCSTLTGYSQPTLHTRCKGNTINSQAAWGKCRSLSLSQESNATGQQGGDSLSEEHRTHDRKVSSSNPGRSHKRIFFSRVNFECWFLFGVHSAHVLPQWHIKDTGYSAKSAGGRLHLTTQPWPNEVSVWADYAAVQAQCGYLSRNELTCDLSGNTQSQSSQLNKPLWTDPGLKSGINVCKLISTSKKKKKKERVGNEWLNILPKSSQARKKPPPLDSSPTLLLPTTHIHCKRNIVYSQRPWWQWKNWPTSLKIV